VAAQVPARSVTPRGFAVYDEFTDTYGNQVRVQQSSSASGPRAWIFAEHGNRPLPPRFRERLAAAGFAQPDDLAELASFLTPAPHLDVEQAKRLIAALSAFVAEHEVSCG
jgi:hypothetical protein